ncbi:MAG TPA: N-acetylmuramoyl-L-alanine amidase [Firmicutes bacterium]|nr:N-acetylmuramoyl-L-alanine amidase [Candidatus Fermentithermobacillaceae bacterium]
MKKRVLNAWPSTRASPQGEWVSRLVLETTALPGDIQVERFREGQGPDHVLRITLDDIGLTMAEDDILVADGLIKTVRVRAGENNRSVNVEIILEHPVEARVLTNPGLPSTVEIIFPRDPLITLFNGHRIGIDPGHGGRDRGVRGPVNLLEKDVVLQIAQELSSLLKQSGAEPVVSRQDDTELDDDARHRIISEGRAELCVQLHTSADKDPMVQRYRLFVKRDCDKSLTLATELKSALKERMGINIPGYEFIEDTRWSIPVVRIEPLCLSHFVDEANFRAPLFRKRIAQSIYNGIARYLRKFGTT